MVIGTLPQADRFKQQIRESFRKQSSDCRTVRVARNNNIYVSGQQDQTIYFVHVGQVKLLLPSPEEKECLFAVRTAGDIFGELCLAGQVGRLETAVAMEDTCLKQISASSFLARLRNESLMEGFVQYLAARLAEQQDVIATMVTLNSEKRLARSLIQLARVLGQPDSGGARIAQKISQEELAGMVGTTRTRIGLFLKRFRELGFIGLSPERCLVVDSARLKSFLDRPSAEESDADCPYRKVEAGAAEEASTARCMLHTDAQAASSSAADDFYYP